MRKPSDNDTQKNLAPPPLEDPNPPAVRRFKYRTDPGMTTDPGDPDKALLRGLSRAREKIDDRENHLGSLLDQAERMPMPPPSVDESESGSRVPRKTWAPWTIVPMRGKGAWTFFLYGTIACAVAFAVIVIVFKMMLGPSTHAPAVVPSITVAPVVASTHVVPSTLSIPPPPAIVTSTPDPPASVIPPRGTSQTPQPTVAPTKSATTAAPRPSAARGFAPEN